MENESPHTCELLSHLPGNGMPGLSLVSQVSHDGLTSCHALRVQKVIGGHVSFSTMNTSR